MKQMEELLSRGHIQYMQRITNRHGLDRCLLPTSLHPQNMVRLEGFCWVLGLFVVGVFFKWIHKTGHMTENYS